MQVVVPTAAALVLVDLSLDLRRKRHLGLNLQKQRHVLVAGQAADRPLVARWKIVAAATLERRAPPGDRPSRLSKCSWRTLLLKRAMSPFVLANEAPAAEPPNEVQAAVDENSPLIAACLVIVQ